MKTIAALSMCPLLSFPQQAVQTGVGPTDMTATGADCLMTDSAPGVYRKDSIVKADFSANKKDSIVITKAGRQRSFKESIAKGNYSGLAYVGDNRFVVCNDKTSNAGFYFLDIEIDSLNGKLRNATMSELISNNSLGYRDEEGIAFVPKTQTVFISGEKRQDIIELRMDGTPTGRELLIPDIYKKTWKNGGFESLTYNDATKLFWTASEVSLKADGIESKPQNGLPNRLRLQSFNDSLQPAQAYAYQTELPTKKSKYSTYVNGVSDIEALDDGRLLVLEREIYIKKHSIGSWVENRIFIVDPAVETPLVASDSLTSNAPYVKKTLLYKFRTYMNFLRQNFSNYEGMALGPRLKDGRQVLLLICDSADQYKGILSDWLQVLLVEYLK